MRQWGLVLAGIALTAALSQAQPSTPLEKYRLLPHPPTAENFDKGWQDRVILEFEIVNAANLAALRAALGDANHFVRAQAARALGIRGDAASADALAQLARTDPEPAVRIRAVEALGFLKEKAEVVEQARQDQDFGVQWTAMLAAGQMRSMDDHAAIARKAYAQGIQRELLGSAQVGKPAPDFSALTLDGQPFKLSDVLGTKPIAIYFAAFEG